jgi:hypothetical protein
LAAKTQPIYSGAINIPAQANEKFGKTVGTLKLYASRNTENPKLPVMNGYVIINTTGKEKDKQYFQVAVWEPQPE